MKSHYREIDILKGIAIFMVILGHSIIVYPIDLSETEWCYYIHRLVSSTHMPLFFVISGFCFGFHDWYSYLLKKSKRILIPLIFFDLFGVVVSNMFAAFVNNPKPLKDAIISVVTGKSGWFLYTLFLIFLVFPFLMKVFNSRGYATAVIAFLGVLQLFDFWPDIFNISNLVKYIFYFSFGFCCRVLIMKEDEVCLRLIKGMKKPYILTVSLPVWCCLVLLLIKMNGTFSYTILSIISILTAFTGMICVVSFSFFIMQYRFSKMFEEAGKISLQIFLFNGYFLTITRTIIIRMLGITSPFVIIAANVFMMYFVSFAFIQLFVKRVRLLRVITGMV